MQWFVCVVCFSVTSVIHIYFLYKTVLGIDLKKCSLADSHKVFFGGVRKLLHHKINVNVIYQKPGHLILSAPSTLHSGFNLGLNYSESVNFSLGFDSHVLSFLNKRRQSTKCDPCISNLNHTYHIFKDWDHRNKTNQLSYFSRRQPINYNKFKIDSMHWIDFNNINNSNQNKSQPKYNNNNNNNVHKNHEIPSMSKPHHHRRHRVHHHRHHHRHHRHRHRPHSYHHQYHSHQRSRSRRRD